MTLLQYYLSGSAEQSDYQEVGMEYLFDKAMQNIIGVYQLVEMPRAMCRYLLLTLYVQFLTTNMGYLLNK